MNTAKIIPIFGNGRRKRGEATKGNRKLAAEFLKVADNAPIHQSWVTIVRPGGMVEQIDLNLH